MARPRGTGGGYIEERGGKFRARITISGERLYETFDRKRDADAWLTTMKAKANAGAVKRVQPFRMTVGQWLGQWLAGLKGIRDPKTWEDYDWAVRLHLAAPGGLGEHKLADIRPDHVLSFYQRKIDEGRLARTSIQHLHRALRAAMNDAVEWGYLTHNPIAAVKMPRASKREHTVWTIKDVNTFLAGLANERWEAAFRLAVGHGLRPEELLALKWEDLDIDEPAQAFLQIRRKRVRLKGGRGFHVGDPKTHQSRRIKLAEPVARALLAWRQGQLDQRTRYARVFRDEGWVFTSRFGTPVETRNLNQYFNVFLTRIGVPRIRLYDLRHTCATLLIEANVPLKVVAEMFGHADPSMLLKVYAHVTPTMQDDAAKMVAALMQYGTTEGSRARESGALTPTTTR